MTDDKPTVLTAADLDIFMEKMFNGDFDPKMKPCFSCGKESFYNYGANLVECDECYFNRFPKEQREAFFRSFF